ncbi:MAG TPA: hypothetical protein VNT75_33020 [Symbiobacteriaceae bacterium]|nr:hypothetical protein [Symbiobacteriaceae bacterium]
MGGFLVSVFVRSEDQTAVLEAAKGTLGPQYQVDPVADLQQKMRKLMPPGDEVKFGGVITQFLKAAFPKDMPLFLVSPSRNGWVGVHDSKMQGQGEALCADVARQLSGRLNTTAVTFLIHDGDFLCYWLARNGELLDEYNSMPGYFDEGPSGEPSGGDPALLAEACCVPGQVAELAKLLSGPAGNPFDQLESLGRVLQLVDPTVDYDSLTYRPPDQIGMTRPGFEAPQIADRTQYISVTKADLNG